MNRPVIKADNAGAHVAQPPGRAPHSAGPADSGPGEGRANVPPGRKILLVAGVSLLLWTCITIAFLRS